MFSNSEGTKKMESLCFNIFVSISYAEFQRVDTSKTNVSSGASVSAIPPVSLLAPSKYRRQHRNFGVGTILLHGIAILRMSSNNIAILGRSSNNYCNTW